MTVTVTNSGNIAGAAIVSVSGFGLLRAESMTDSNGACPAPTGAGQYTCSFTSIDVGGSASIIFGVEADAPGTFPLVATPRGGTATGVIAGPATGASLAVGVGPPVADLALHLPHVPLRPKVGTNSTLTISLSNLGPSPLTAPATIAVTLPPQLVLKKARPYSSGCSGKPTVCQFTIGGLLPNGSAVITLTLKAMSPGGGSIAIVASSPVTDPAATNNTAAVAVLVPKPKAKPKG